MPDIIGIVLINFNNVNDTKECLRSISSSTIKPIVIVVDNNSDRKPNQGELSAIYKDTNLILNDANVGFAKGNNIGFDYLNRNYFIDYVLILNNDTIIEKNSLEVLLTTFSIKKIDALTCKIIDLKNRVWYAGGEIDFFRGWPILKDLKLNNDLIKTDQSRRITFISGCLFMMRAETYERFGGFDERYFMYVEDLDLSYRMIKKGLVLYYTDKTQIIHKVNSSFGSSEKKDLDADNPNLLFHFYHKLLYRYLMMRKLAPAKVFLPFFFYYWAYFFGKNIEFLIKGRIDILNISFKILKRILFGQ